MMGVRIVLRGEKKCMRLSFIEVFYFINENSFHK